jgi:hypothetical protein
MKAKLFELDKRQLSTRRHLLVIGDLHGDYVSLRSALDLFDPTKDNLVFLGDYADRGDCGVEVIEAVDALRRKHPENVLPLKGNHEDYTEARCPKFSPCNLVDEANRKTDGWESYFENKLEPFIKSLYLGAIIPGKALFVHGGVSSKIECLNDLRHPTADVETDVLWSDPFEGNGEYLNQRGAGIMFGKDITTRIFEDLSVKRIIRSHEPMKVKLAGGPCYSHEHRIITTSTTTVYGGKPYVLAINPRSFSCECYQVGYDTPTKSRIVNCGQ